MQAGTKRKIHNEINITPLTDVFLVLLIIMMLLQTSATLKYAGLIRPPEVDGAERVRDADRNCVIEITGKGPNGEPEKISIDREEVTSPDQLGPILDRKASAHEKGKLLLRADKDASSKIVMDVVDTIQQAANGRAAESEEFKFLSTLTISVEQVRVGALPAPGTDPVPATEVPVTSPPATTTPGAAS